ncbi:MAG TPA: HAD hydrolase-like protein [Candidatus Levybacteria bacterium]|nr:HAD hydrolase-like protein [Candidatus Levybacteria bacterium]
MSETIRAVLFDHDDTLVGTKESKWAHHKHVANQFYGKDLSDEDILPHWGKPLPELVGLLYGTDDIEQALINNTSCHEQFPKILFDGTIPTLKDIKFQGKLTGLVTATTRFSLDHDLLVHGISKDLLDYIQTAEDTQFHKPDSRVFEPTIIWLSTQDIQVEQVLYVADGLHDMKAALGAGLQFLGVETGLTTRDQFLEHGVESIISIAELSNILR